MNFSNTFKPSNTAMLNFQKTNYLKMYLATWDFSYFKISDYTLFWYISKVAHCISIFSANLLQRISLSYIIWICDKVAVDINEILSAFRVWTRGKVVTILNWSLEANFLQKICMKLMEAALVLCAENFLIFDISQPNARILNDSVFVCLWRLKNVTKLCHNYCWSILCTFKYPYKEYKFSSTRKFF